MLNQTRYAKEKMEAAGFAKKDLRVRVSRKFYQRDGRRHTEYGDATIICWASHEEQIERMEATLEAGIDILAFTKNGEISSLHFSDRGRDQGTWSEYNLNTERFDKFQWDTHQQI